MKPYIFNIINSIALIGFGLWGYLGSDTPSITALIPVFAGVLLLVLTKGVKAESKIVSHIVVTLTLVVLIALFKPLSGAISRNGLGAVLRILAMMVTGGIALIVYIKSFIDVRKNRKAA